MTGFELWKYLHVVSAIAWVGGAIAIFVLQTRLGSAGDRAGLMAVGGQMEWMGKRYYAPIAAVTLITGIGAVASSNVYGYGDVWVIIGLAGIAVTMGIGLGVIAPTGKKLLAEGAKTPPDPGAMAALSGRIRALTLVNTAILLIVVWAMVTRPGG
jgi:uncharacterized membrane protein